MGLSAASGPLPGFQAPAETVELTCPDASCLNYGNVWESEVDVGPGGGVLDPTCEVCSTEGIEVTGD